MKLGVAEMGRANFGAACLREFDLTLAANLERSLRDGSTLYNDDLDIRLADRCAPLDTGLRPGFAGVRDLLAVPDAPHLSVEVSTEFLKAEARGTWVILREPSGGLDAYMSDGLGGIGTRSGKKFDVRSPDDQRLSFLATYASTLSRCSYERRKTMTDEFVRASYEAADKSPGRVARDIHVAGRKYDRVEDHGIEPGSEGGVHLLRMARRGVRTLTGRVDAANWCKVFAPPLVVPPAYDGANIPERLLSMPERRRSAAQAAYDRGVAEGLGEGIGHLGCRAPFLARGDVHERAAYGSDGFDGSPPVGTVRVTFAPGSDEVLSTEFDLDALRPSLG